MEEVKTIDTPKQIFDQLPFMPRFRWRFASDTMERFKTLSKNSVRFVTNDLITKWFNATYNSYSKFYEGQLRLGLPVSKELIKTQEEMRSIAAGKLASDALSYIPPGNRHAYSQKEN